jgi:hypothetical protein
MRYHNIDVYDDVLWLRGLARFTMEAVRKGNKV